MKKQSAADLFEKELRERARQVKTPLIGSFEITGRCNFDCKMCYVHTMDHAYARKHELSTSQWIEIMDAAYDAGMFFAVISGGECLLRSDFEELYLHLYNKGVRVTVLTNGSLITEERIRFFAEHKPKRLQISLYGSNDETYREVTGQGGSEKILNTLYALREQNINLEVAVTPSKFLLNDIENIISLLEEGRFTYSVNPYLIEPRESIERGSFKLDESEILKVFRIINQAKGKAPAPIDLNELPKPGGYCDEVIHGIECNAGVISFAVTWDGYMIPCASIPQPRINLLEEGFANSWEKLRKHDSEVLQAAECRNCAYKSVCARCPVIRSENLYCGHCNESVCQLTVSRVRAGLATLSQS